MTTQAPIVVIGAGLAAYNLVKEFRKLDQDTPVMIISQDDAHSYSKPMLSTGYAKGKSADDLSMGDPGKMAITLKASIRNHTTVSEIDTLNKQVMIGDERITYNKLVLAVGAQVNKLSFPGSDSEKVYSINDLEDYRQFRAAAEGKQHVLIMGAGLIGCEYANDLHAGGYQVTLVNPASQPLTNLVPEPIGKALAQGLYDAGIDLRMDTAVSAIEESGETLKARLTNGQEIECDLVISAVGLKANIALANTAGIACDKGIITNEFLETSAKDVYALGDCAETFGQVRLYVLPLMSSARALAKTIAGTPTAVSFGAMPVATKTPACPVVVLPPETSDGSWVFDGEGQDLCGRFSNTEGQLKGFALSGTRCKEKQALVKELN